MSTFATKATPTYLRAARIAAGYANRDTAAAEVPFSPETIGRHERGEIPVAPEDAMVYAKCYGCEDILLRFCSDCPVGRATGRRVTDRDLPFATLRLTRRLRWAAKEIVDPLESIADDGVLVDTKRPMFDTSLLVLRELNESIADYLLYAAMQGKEKSRPAKAKATPQTQSYSISKAPPCQLSKFREEARS